jgi:hypothetical protein
MFDNMNKKSLLKKVKMPAAKETSAEGESNEVPEDFLDSLIGRENPEADERSRVDKEKADFMERLKKKGKKPGQASEVLGTRG